jgi:hypothetical protein
MTTEIVKMTKAEHLALLKDANDEAEMFKTGALGLKTSRHTKQMIQRAIDDGELIRLPNGNLIEKEQLQLRDAAPDMLAALQAVAPLLAAALKAYQFGASSYTYEAMVACMKARDVALAAITKATVVEEPDIEEKTFGSRET